MAGRHRARLTKAERELGPDNAFNGALTFSQFRSWRAWKQRNPEVTGAFLVVPGPIPADKWQAMAKHWQTVILPPVLVKVYGDLVTESEPEQQPEPEEATEKLDQPQPESTSKKKQPSLSPHVMHRRRERDAENWRKTIRRW